MILKLEGRTQLGKNRVREHGESWKVVKITQEVIFSDRPGPWFLIEPVKTGEKGKRWINSDFPIDFFVEVC